MITNVDKGVGWMELTVSNSEWDLMRVVWSLDQATSAQIIAGIQTQRSWSASTIKTMLKRLVDKGWLTFTKQGRRFNYQATIDEHTAMSQRVADCFAQICDMHKGEILYQAIDNAALSQSDIEKLQTLLAQKALTAPQAVACNCIECRQCQEEEK